MTSLKGKFRDYSVDERSLTKLSVSSFSRTLSVMTDKSEKQNDSSAVEKSVDGPEEEEREQWGSPVEFILSAVGYSVGLGNVWRFPYLCYANGGGAFLVPYIIAVIIAGRPIYFLELTLGQFSQSGPNRVFEKMAPLFTGVGWGMVMMSAICSIYYNMIIAWTLFYLFSSFRSKLMWDDCHNDWNTIDCRSNREDVTCRSFLKDNGSYYFNGSCVGSAYVQDFDVVAKIRNASDFNLTWKSPSDEYFHNYVLNIDHEGLINPGELGGMSWKLVLCLLGAWIVVYLCLIKGVQSVGKVVYFTATFPYAVLVILLIRGATLPGAIDGIIFYIKPTFHKLTDTKVWYAAASQVFYSLGTAFGGLIAMSSHNKFNNNCHRDALIVAVIDSFTSLFAGFAIFSIIGFMAHDLDVPVDKVTSSGPGLAFVAYPEALSRMPGGPFWSILFFFMLFTLGLDSQFAMVETLSTAIFDQFPSLKKFKQIILGGCCIILFLVGLPLCTRNGMYIFQLIDGFSAGYSLLLISLFEVVTVVYVYGLNNYMQDIECMLGYRPGWYWKICWYALCPAFLLFIFIFSFVGITAPKYGTYTFTPWLQGVGWFISILSIGCIPVFAIYYVIKFYREGKPMKDLIKPSPEWRRYTKTSKFPLNDTPPSYSEASGKFGMERIKGLFNKNT